MEAVESEGGEREVAVEAEESDRGTDSLRARPDAEEEDEEEEAGMRGQDEVVEDADGNATAWAVSCGREPTAATVTAACVCAAL